jgi:hypothetical protein
LEEHSYGKESIFKQGDKGNDGRLNHNSRAGFGRNSRGGGGTVKTILITLVSTAIVVTAACVGFYYAGKKGHLGIDIQNLITRQPSTHGGSLIAETTLAASLQPAPPSEPKPVHIDLVDDGIVMEDAEGRFVTNESGKKCYLGKTEYDEGIKGGLTDTEFEGLLLIVNPCKGIGNDTRTSLRLGYTDINKPGVRQRANAYLQKVRQDHANNGGAPVKFRDYKV